MPFASVHFECPFWTAVILKIMRVGICTAQFRIRGYSCCSCSHDVLVVGIAFFSFLTCIFYNPSYLSVIWFFFVLIFIIRTPLVGILVKMIHNLWCWEAKNGNRKYRPQNGNRVRRRHVQNPVPSHSLTRVIIIDNYFFNGESNWPI